MICNAFSKNDIGEYNVSLVKAIGLIPAVLMGEYVYQYSIAEANGSIRNNELLFNRDLAKKRTTITITEQKEIESKLSEILLITKPDADGNVIKINFEKILSIVSEESEESFKQLKDMFHSSKSQEAEKKRVGKMEARVNQLKNFIHTNNTELFNAYTKWISALVYSNDKRYITEGAVEEAQRKVDEACKLPNGKHNLEIALSILDIATKFEYNNIDWAIKKYRDSRSNFGLFTAGTSADANQPWLDSSTIGA